MTLALNQHAFTNSLSIRPDQYSSDEVLLQTICLNGDEKAYRLLINRYFERLLEQAQNILHCLHAAEEVVCDVFIKIWENRQRLQIRTKVRYYLHAAVRNQSIDRLRKRMRERSFQSELVLDKEPVSLSGEDYLIERELAERIEYAVASLPPQGRHIFRLSREEGKKYREIADELNISIKTVETHMRRSLMQLRDMLNDA